MPFMSKQYAKGGPKSKRKLGKKVTTVGQVQTIAKRVINSAAETKSYLSGGVNISPLDDAFGVANLIFPMAQGSAATNYTGEQIYLKNLHIKGRIFTNAGASSITNTKLCRIVVFRTKKALTNTVTNAATILDVFRNNPPGLATTGHVDFTKVKLLYDQTITITPQLGTAGGVQTQVINRPFDIKIPINKKEWFDADNSGYLQYSNIYIGYTSYDGNAVQAPTTCSFAWTVNFKDM